jgi:prepilin-type processing-associated H-X9-DG protein
MLRAAPISLESYAPFGALISPRASAPRSANHGNAEAWDDLAPLVNARGDRARPTVWHHPMVALDREADFVNFLFADGSAGDCDERAFDPPCARVTISG